MKEQYYRLEQDDQLIWNLRDIGHTMRHISEGKGSQKRVLIVLLESGPMTQRELTERLDIQPGSVSEVLGKLESAGLIGRTPSQRDRRTTDIVLTEQGEAMAREAYRRRKERHQRMFEVLSPQEKDTLLALLERVNADWDEKFRAREAD